MGELFSIVAPVFICSGIGFARARTGRTFDLDQVTTLVTDISAPCLVFHILANLTIEAATFASVAGATVADLLICTVVGAVILWMAGLSQRSFLPALIFPNTGNMGLPLSYLAFGDIGLGLAIGVFSVFVVAQFTVGAALASGHASLRTLAQVPILYAVPAALTFMLSGTTPPEWINATADLLGGITIPMMLITRGMSLARLGVGSLPRSLGLAGLRLGMGFTVGLGLTSVLGLEGAARGK